MPPALLPVALALLSAAVVRAMISVRVMDLPDAGQPGARKSHDRPVPKGGGVGVVVSFCAGAALLGLPFPLALMAALGVAAVALLDDLRSWSYAVKLGAQLAAAGCVVASGLMVRRVGAPGWGELELGLAAAPLTLAWLLFATNAMNFIDGLNGLASGSSLLAGAALWVIAPGVPAMEGAVLASGLAGFVPFNYPRARIFMGDVGSQFCGFVLAVLAVAGASEGALLPVPLMLFGILYDVAFTLARRIVARESVVRAHRGHLYQVAQRSAVPAMWIAPVHWGFVVWGAACAWFAGRGWPWASAMVLPPQLVWTAFVVWRAQAAGLGRW